MKFSYAWLNQLFANKLNLKELADDMTMAGLEIESIHNEVIKDFQLATTYPPEERDQVSAQQITELVHLICEKIKRERSRAK